MTAAAKPFLPDRWLVLAPATHRALCGLWAEHALPRGLYRLRIDAGLIEPVAADALPARLQALASEGTRRMCVVADRLDNLNVPSLVHLAGQMAPDVDVQLFSWPRDAQAVLDHLALPDALLLQRAALSVQARAPRFALAPPAGWPDHERALHAWQEAAHDSNPEGFEARYGAAPIPWTTLLGGEGQPAAVMAPSAALLRLAQALTTTVEAAAEMLRQLLQPALLPAPLAAAPAGARLPDERRHRGGLYTLTLSPALNDPDVFYIHFEMDEARAAAGQGRQVSVRIGDEQYELGPVDANGLAELRVRGPLPRGLPIEVAIGGLPDDPPAPDEPSPT